MRCFGVSLDEIPKEMLSSEELRIMTPEASASMPVEHKSMQLSLLDFEQATVEDIMVPKADIIAIDLNQPWHAVIEQLKTAQYTRLPLYQDNIEDLVGIIHVREILILALEKRLDKDNLLDHAEKPYFIPEATPLNVQILNFQKMKKRSCFVVDEYGDLQGLVTLEDILEEVAGDFISDIAALNKDILPQSNGSLIIDASITLRYLKRLTGWQLPLLGPRTLSGLIIEHLGYIPPAECCLRVENYQIEILKVSDNMIKSVRMINCSPINNHT